jgi:hypothetical protein
VESLEDALIAEKLNIMQEYRNFQHSERPLLVTTQFSKLAFKIDDLTKH